MGEMVKIASLPRALQEATIGSCVCDATNLAELLDVATTRMQHLSGLSEEYREARNSLAAFLWLATDVVDQLRWKLERIEREQEEG